MTISPIDQEVSDLDWFAVDPHGHLGHFSSAGGPLPASVASSHEALKQLQHYFWTYCPPTTTAHINPDLAQLLPRLAHWLELPFNRHCYTEQSLLLAQCGLFSFNRTEIELPYQDTHYHLVAYPEQPLLLAELPPNIRAVISRTRFPATIVGVVALDIKYIE